MNEPRRLREVSGSTVEHALLSAGASYRSSAAAHAKTLGALGLASSAALSAGVASAGAAGIFSKLGWAKVLSLVSLSLAVIAPVTYVALRSPSSDAAPSAAVAPAAPAQARAPEPVIDSLLPSTALSESAPEAAAVVDVDKAAPPAALRTIKPDANTKADSVAAELAAIDGARAALARGDANGALARLDSYARTYPRGRLSLEAEVLRIDALARSGQTAAASKRAEAFLRRHPNSVLASRVRGYLKP
jgi:hypothetical protein